MTGKADFTDEEWHLIEPLIPAAKRGGNKRSVNIREVVNAIFYRNRNGCLRWSADASRKKNVGDIQPSSRTCHEIG